MILEAPTARHDQYLQVRAIRDGVVGEDAHTSSRSYEPRLFCNQERLKR
jgi:hypothetical protein